MTDSILTRLIRGGSQYDLAGPTVNDDIRRAVARYGATAVRDAVKQQTKLTRGRKPEKDWPELREVITADAREWLDGGDPLGTRSNYSIAKEFALKNPGQNPVSTHQRIERKLKKKPYDRRWYMFVTAERISQTDGPHVQHLKALKELIKLGSKAGSSNWELILQYAEAAIADYTAKIGHSPAPDLSMKDIENASSNALLGLSPRKTGLLGYQPPPHK